MKARAVRCPARIPRALLFYVAVGVLLAGCGSPSQPAPPTSSGATPSPATSPATVTPAPGTPAEPALRHGYLPLWPFPDGASVLAWQAAYRSGGHEPWHLDAGATALAFTRGFLDYTEVDRVTSRAVTSGDALIGVGWLNPNQEPVTVATVHLLRFGTGATAPWEVVGTRDARLSLTIPRYGARVTSPVQVGGRITGVDESLVVVIRVSPAGDQVGRAAPLPAGGENQPWRTTVGFTAPAGSVLTIAVSTGGHLAAVEAFAITGVRAAVGGTRSP